ncbi:hypothetical protein M2272_000681 [Mycobacterium frederiksbergense]|uniref:Uncharacterized protein n=1 Tax=Mycolicibacterium frederiksbergense TaxID=117567 RepID=A0ABT6KW34_9MYCO|nr:hypothetical protein [Mycolicibacterium frederiksbergense]MDH6194060.1 hypothetical protein [Mycolicibacterium frederiksbergense]
MVVVARRCGIMMIGRKGVEVVGVLRTLPWAVLVCCVVAVGCTTANRPPVATTTTAAPSLSPREEAREVMDYFGLPLPTHAEHVRVVKPPLGAFRAKSLVSFVAPGDEVIMQTCHKVKYMDLDYVPSMTDTDSDILKYAGITINDNDYGSCGQDVGGRKILVLVPQVEGGTTYVVLHHMSFD